jgi:hypothetical protein
MTHVITRRWLPTTIALACLALAVVVPDWQRALRAQGYYQPAEDHLECFKIKDSVKLSGLVDIDSTAFGLQGGCRISTARMYCTPAVKIVEQVFSGQTQIDPTEVPGFPGLGDRLCYKVKCPVRSFPDRALTDQFGVHTIGRFKASLLCTPTTTRIPCRTTCCYLSYLGSSVACLQYTGLEPQASAFQTGCRQSINVFGVVGYPGDGPCDQTPFGGTCRVGQTYGAVALPADSGCSP